VAHDFNNLLTVIRAHGEFLLQQLPANTDARLDAQQVVRAADRAAQLTRQLLAFSRRQTLDPRRLRPAELVADLGGMLSRLIDAGWRSRSTRASRAGGPWPTPASSSRWW
jgi:signal transduction histidine kinase